MRLFRNSNTRGLSEYKSSALTARPLRLRVRLAIHMSVMYQKKQSPYLRQCQLKYKKFKILNDLHFHRLNKRDLEYAALEDEFRMGLQIEANRFREVGHDFEKHFYQFMKNLKYCFFRPFIILTPMTGPIKI